jgi:hypothetical protein
MSCRLVHFDGRPARLATGRNGSSTARGLCGRDVSGGAGFGDFGDHAGLWADVDVHPQAQRA